MSVFVPSDPDDVRGTQAALRMIVETATGAAMSAAVAEAVTGFSPGASTWPCVMLATMAQRGWDVRELSAFDPHRFASGPAGGLRRRCTDPASAASIVAGSTLRLKRTGRHSRRPYPASCSTGRR